MAKKENIIEISKLSKSFEGIDVLRDINLSIGRGEFITFLGPSGCGKTTLLRLIGGFLKADEGTITMEGKDITDTPPYLRKLNTVFQKYALFPHLDVFENVAFGLKLQKMQTKEMERRVRKVLKMVSMSDYEDRDIESLSGGQQQRVAIARALANNPDVLLLDEPLSALDAKMRKDMQMELKELHQKMGITFIFVTHDQEEALVMSDTVVVMNEGRIQQIGTPSDIYNEPVNEFVADFIGDSTILDAVMLEDRRVSFVGHDFDCVDEGFGNNTPVDVVIRPEDVYIMNSKNGAQFTGVVKSCTFKGVFYEIFVDTDNGYEMMIQDYNAFEIGSEVGMIIKPQDIQVMHKKCTRNEFTATVVDRTHLEVFSEVMECKKLGEQYPDGSTVKVAVEFGKVELLDHQEDGVLWGDVHFTLYKGNHYHLQVRLDTGEDLYVDTNDIWDRGDLVGIRIAPKDFIIIGQ